MNLITPVSLIADESGMSISTIFIIASLIVFVASAIRSKVEKTFILDAVIIIAGLIGVSIQVYVFTVYVLP